MSLTPHISACHRIISPFFKKGLRREGAANDFFPVILKSPLTPLFQRGEVYVAAESFRSRRFYYHYTASPFFKAGRRGISAANDSATIISESPLSSLFQRGDNNIGVYEDQP